MRKLNVIKVKFGDFRISHRNPLLEKLSKSRMTYSLGSKFLNIIRFAIVLMKKTV